MTYLIALTFLLAPAYIIKFSVFDLPLNLLMAWVFLLWLVFIVWLIIKKQLSQYLTAVKYCDWKILLFSSLFFVSGIISLFVGGVDRTKLGQFVVLFIQPISVFFIAGYIFQQHPKSKNLLLPTSYFLLAFSGLYAILQYFTLLGLPPAWWGNSVEPKRAISFFAHPNFYALWSAPLLAFLIPDVFSNLKSKIIPVRRSLGEGGNLKSIAWTIGALGLLLSMSRAGWFGLAAAVLIYLIFAADAKIRKIIFSGVIVIVIVIFVTPNLKWRFIMPFYGESSANSRVELWQSGIRAIKTSPILGLGLNGYANNYKKFQPNSTLETHNFPHNIFLDLWVETGLIGLISLVGLIGIYVYRGLRRAALLPWRGEMSPSGDREVERLNKDQITKLSIALFLIALITQGLIDNPYFKNDLAMVFWIILALAF